MLESISMDGLFTLENLLTLGMLIMLQAVLGFDNLLYISLESKRVAPEKQAFLRKLGIGMAVFLRIFLLYALLKVLDAFKEPLFELNFPGLVEGEFNLHAVVVLGGGVFILYTALKEIMHMMMLEEGHAVNRKPRNFFIALTWIVVMNAVFSFDSILSAMALTTNFIVMATAIVIGGILMIVAADFVTEFLQKNRMYEVVGLFILFLVGVMLLSEGGHVSHLKFFGNEITPMSKTTFYFTIAVIVIIDIVQGRYQRKLLMAKEAAAKHQPLA